MERFNIVKLLIPSRGIYIFNVMSIKTYVLKDFAQQILLILYLILYYIIHI